MGRRSLGGYLSPRQADDGSSHWESLYKRALKYARKTGDSRVTLLEEHRDTPEHILRSLSIISDADLEREFG